MKYYKCPKCKRATVQCSNKLSLRCNRCGAKLKVKEGVEAQIIGYHEEEYKW